jgi:putative acetyltransferase
MISIDRDDPTRQDVHQLLSEHLADMFATSPAESVHALDHSALSSPSITFWTAREAGGLLGAAHSSSWIPRPGPPDTAK